MSQSHFTVSFSLKGPGDAKELAEQLPLLMSALFQALDTIGRVYSSRFTILDQKTLLFLGDFDGEFGALMADLATYAGPLFDAIFRHVENPPHTPVASNVNAFVEWTAEHLLQAATLFSAYPDVTVKEIKALAAAAGVTGAGKQLPFLVNLPIKSSLAYAEVQLLLRVRAHRTQKDLALVGTLHFAQFVPLGSNRVGFFTVYDGSFEKYIEDFAKYIGPVFDLVFKFTKDPPPSPCQKHVQEFIDFAAGVNRVPIGFYQAYPGLTVQDIHALIADSQAESAATA
jgi:hypothetical protein